MTMRRSSGVLGRWLIALSLVAGGLVSTAVVSTVLAAPAAADPAPAAASQLITVRSSIAGSTTATLTAWERGSDNRWRVAIGPVSAHVGAGGIGRASEGSTRTPAGSFPLTQAFGRQADPGTSMPYFRTDSRDWWDENPSSPTYNLHVRQDDSPGGASENLYDSGSVYDYVVNMDYNTARVPGAGSAFFLHVSDGTPTAGCVSVDRSVMVAILRWLDPARHPYISIGVGAPWRPAVPAGGVDLVHRPAVGRLGVSGWVADASVPGAAVRLWVTVAGPAGTKVYGSVTGRSRPDVARVHPWAGGATGFALSVPAQGAGVNRVCAYAAPAQQPTKLVLLSCRTVRVQDPFGALGAVAVSHGRLVGTGWALDPVHPARHVRVHLRDTSTGGLRMLAVPAGLSRPDVARAHPGYGTLHGFSFAIPLGAHGRHRVCAYAIGIGGSMTNPLLGCRDVTA